MDPKPLVREEVEAGNAFLDRFEAAIPVVAAFWVRDDEADRWSLHVASDRFRDGAVGSAYGDVLRIAAEMRNPVFDAFRVRLVGLHDPLARAVVEFYLTHPPRIPFRPEGGSFHGVPADDIYMVRGPRSEYEMPTGREVLERIIDEEAEFFRQRAAVPRKMRLPVLMAYDLAKCSRNELGDLSGRVFKEGIAAFETEGFHGMDVEIVRDKDAVLQFE